MDSKLYVGNLSYNTTQEQLKALFAQCGEVTSVDVIIDRLSGHSKGFAFIQMATQTGAEKAIATLDGTELDSRSIKVSLARPREEKGRSGGGYGRRNGDSERRPGQWHDRDRKSGPRDN